jgi:hypothetical protein
LNRAVSDIGLTRAFALWYKGYLFIIGDNCGADAGGEAIHSQQSTAHDVLQN